MFQTIPLGKLVASPRNVRRHTDAAADAELKASIAAHGLLQNLVVRAGPKGKFEVEAGERRRRAMLALAEDKVLPRDHQVTCLVLSADNEAAPEASLAENFHRLAMNPADEAQAFAALIEGGATTEQVARRFGLTVRFVEGRLRLATLAPVVFDALAAGEITLDMAKAYGATSDQQIQARVFTEISGAYYSPTPDSIRRMVLTGTVRGSDPRAKLVGRDAYIAAGGRIERELFDNADTESWVDVALLESLATEKMAEEALVLAKQNGLAWVKPTLDPYASHDLVEGLVRLPAEPAPLSKAEAARLEELDASWDEHAAVLEDEDSAPEAIEAAEAAIAAIELETQDIRNRPPVLPDDHKGSAGMILTLSREGKPVLQPVFYGERNVAAADGEDSIEVVSSDGEAGLRLATLSRRLVDELAMQRRDVLALHLASDPALALDVMVFTLADADSHDWQARTACTIRGGLPNGPLVGFEPADAAATRALVELRAGLDETWRSGRDQCERFDRFRALSDEARAAWLGHVVARSLEASLNMSGERRIPFQDHLGALIGIDIAQWWRPTAANYFDRVPKQVILEALGDVGGAELASRYMSVKKADLAASAERIFAGATIAEVAERERALAWVPEVMRFGGTAAVDDQGDVDTALADDQQPDPSDGMADHGPSEASPCDLAA